VAVILEEAIDLAGTGRESRSPIVLVLEEADKGGKVSLSRKQISQKLAGMLDLIPLINQR
jgi:hypothetical protein